MPDNRFLTFLKKERGLWKIALLFAVGLFFLLFGQGRGSTATGGTEDGSLESYRRATESEVASLCSEIRNVGKCKVYITFESGETTRYQGTKAIGCDPPRVYAVAVVCEGGGRADVREALVPMLSSLFGIGANRVSILPLG